MNAHRCCWIKARAGDNTRQPVTRLRRGGEIAGWVLPSITLALIPKCPVCVAAYVALATGLGVSFHIAAYLRMVLVGLCVASLAFVAAGRLRKFIARADSHQ